MHQNDAVRLLPGLPHHIAVNGVRTGVPAYSVLGADIPVHPLPAFLLYFGFQLLHQAFPAVASAHRVGAAAGKPQITDAFCVHIGSNALLQQCNVRPVGFAAAVDIAVLVGSRVQCDLMSGADRFGEQGQILFVVAGSHHKKGGVHPCSVQGIEHIRRGLAGAVIKGQADPLFRKDRSSGLCLHRNRDGRGEHRGVRYRGQILRLTSGDDRRRSRYKPHDKGKQHHRRNSGPPASGKVF